MVSTTADSDKKTATAIGKPKRGWFRRIVRLFVWCVVLLIITLAIARPFMPRVVLFYVNRTLNQSPLYQGKIGGIDIHLWRGAYSIRDVRILKTTGDIPVPLFKCPEVDLAIDWPALMHRKIVGRFWVNQPEVNFVDDPAAGESETGAGGPWLQIIRNLFPFDINSAQIVDGSVHFRTYTRAKPVDVYLSHLNAAVSDLTNVNRSTTPLLTTVTVDALAMDQAKLQVRMKLDPFSYNPTFHLTLRLLGLDITKTNDLVEAYGGFNIKQGMFDLVTDVDCQEGSLNGYVKPLFRNLIVFNLVQDIQQDHNPIQVFWTALVGGASAILNNYNRDQLGTLIPFTGQLKGGPQIDLLATVGNVIRNAFVRAYLPRLEKNSQNDQELQFGPASLADPISVGDQQ